ncbi:hypothetical protein DPMN_164050 [Dreissena polymorpha]|uniref:Uncharacterized protein n=1 Tax=Dreissena polymorpha TaxID=45954 RepID=A0A9D4EUG2_DREPO|nr:hypothetical protein DPMN_164050 [Dreissena polymorpha]
MSSYKLVNKLTAGVEQTLLIIRRLQCRQAANAEEQQIETDDFVEDSYDYDNDADYISSEESDSDCKGTEYPERDTVNIFVEESLNVIQGDGDKEQVEIGKSSIKLVNVQKEPYT